MDNLIDTYVLADRRGHVHPIKVPVCWSTRKEHEALVKESRRFVLFVGHAWIPNSFVCSCISCVNVCLACAVHVLSTSFIIQDDVACKAQILLRTYLVSEESRNKGFVCWSSMIISMWIQVCTARMHVQSAADEARLRDWGDFRNSFLGLTLNPGR